ncbi:MAG TPA: sigma-54 dependent transcriptional regulator, partial [Polyangiaceae bacterium]|nr:sigma-54 dependent transcriptional regulator [Polyangiaceae bacterium]
MVLDLRMADIDGLAVLQTLRARANPPETILHSAFLDVQTTVLAMKCGVADVIEKPGTAQALGDRVLDLVQNKRSSRVESPRGPANSNLGEGDPAVRLLGETPRIRTLREQIRRISKFREVSVLIEGPTGTGKELVAEAIHQLTVPQEAFVTLNCAAVPLDLFESELFGHEAGAFTSAKGARTGLLEQAGAGTLFLDEIGEMPASIQPKLLRVLETREFRRVGSNRSRRLTARVVSATNRPLSGAHDDALRPDLYFRLAGYTIVTPRLCERIEDVPLLARCFLERFATRYGLVHASIEESAIELLQAFDWPGNVRQLKLVVENAVMLAASGATTAEHIAEVLGTRASDLTWREPVSGSYPVCSPVRGTGVSLPDLEREIITDAFSKFSPNLSKTAKHLGIPRSTLRDKLRKFGLL